MTILDKIKHIDFPTDQYIKEVCTKSQIVLHHTVGPDSAEAVANNWITDPRKVATAIVITRDGTPYQFYKSEYWAGHIGPKQEVFDKLGIPALKLDKTSIGIELCNWGGLIYKNGKYYNTYKGEVKNPDIIEFNPKFRGFQFFEKYTNEQIETVKELLIFWSQKYNIPLDYNEDMWDISKDALTGKPGIFSHCAYRTEKSDIFPQPEIIAMLKSLKPELL